MGKAGLLAGLFVVSFLAFNALAIQVNPTSNVICDSASTAETCVYRDTSGNFSAGTITASLTGAVTTTSGVVQVSSATTSAFSLSLDGAYTSAQIQAKTPARKGMLVYNTTLSVICVSTGTTVQGYAAVADNTACQ